MMTIQIADFAGLPRPVLFEKSAEVLDQVKAVLHGWTVSLRDLVTDTAPVDPLVRVLAGPSGYDVLSVEKVLIGQSAVQATSAVLWHLVRAHYAARPEMIPLHGGAVVLGGHLVAISGPSGMGKSTMSARLCCEPGCRVFGDDILLADAAGVGHGVGVLPRLRPPVPANASARFRDFVAASTAPGDEHYQYVTCPDLAPLGTRAPLSAFVILSRKPKVESPGFVTIGPQAAFMEWVGASIGSNAPDYGVHLDRLEQLASRVPCYRLVYSDLEGAIRVLREACKTGQPFSPELQAEIDDGSLAAGDRWTASPDWGMKSAFGGSYLFHRSDGRVVRLNPTAQVVLGLVAAGCDLGEITGLFAETYPDQSPDRLAADIDMTLNWMLGQSILLPEVLGPPAQLT